MPEKEERTFYFYSDGYSPQELSLGHLVIGTYVRPTTGRQCSMEPLSEAELNTWSNVQPRSNVCFSSSSLRGFGISVTALDLVKAGLSVNQENHHAVVSEHCWRITLKNPKQFLSEKVLAVDSTWKAVQEWLSVSNHEYTLRQLTPRGWWPKIWMLTGIYAFENCTSFAWRKNDMSVEANVAAEIMELLNIPVGVTIRATNSGGLYSRQTFDGRSIWAAQYQLLHADCFHITPNERDKPATPLELPLRVQTIYSVGAARQPRTERKEQKNMAVLSLAEVSTGQGDAPESEDEFWEKYAKVEEDFQKYGISEQSL